MTVHYGRICPLVRQKELEYFDVHILSCSIISNRMDGTRVSSHSLEEEIYREGILLCDATIVGPLR